MRKIAIVALVLALTFLVTGAQVCAFACEGMGENVHAGVVKSVGDLSFVLVDASTGSPLTFQTTLDQVTGLRPGEQIKVKYMTDERGRLHVVRIGR